MDELDKKALYWCLKLSRIAVYNQLFTGTDPTQIRPGIDDHTLLLQKNCLDKANTVMMALACELGIDA